MLFRNDKKKNSMTIEVRYQDGFVDDLANGTELDKILR